MKKNIIQIKGVKKSYKDVEVLKGVDFEVEQGGMKRRIDIAMSLVGNPKIIFLDEPTTGLDPEARLEVWRIVKELSAAGTTIFLTTQYLEEAEQLADKITILHGGRMIAIDTLARLRKVFPPIKVEYVEKQPTLEEIFLTIICSLPFVYR